MTEVKQRQEKGRAPQWECCDSTYENLAYSFARAISLVQQWRRETGEAFQDKACLYDQCTVWRVELGLSLTKPYTTNVGEHKRRKARTQPIRALRKYTSIHKGPQAFGEHLVIEAGAGYLSRYRAVLQNRQSTFRKPYKSLTPQVVWAQSSVDDIKSQGLEEMLLASQGQISVSYK